MRIAKYMIVGGMVIAAAAAISMTVTAGYESKWSSSFSYREHTTGQAQHRASIPAAPKATLAQTAH